MSRTYRHKKSHLKKEMQTWFDWKPKLQNNIPDGEHYFYNPTRDLKRHTNWMRRQDAQRYEKEAMVHGDVQFSEREKYYKHLEWVYD